MGRHYDRLDEFYRRAWGESMHHGLWRTGRETLPQAKRQLADLVIQEILGDAVSTPRAVCDIGCGYGALARRLAHEHEAKVLAVTNSAAQQQWAVRPYGPHVSGVTCRLADWLSLELPQGSFDAAIAIESLEHFTDKAAFFTRARHGLKPGASLVLTGWHLGRTSRLPNQICAAAKMPPLVTEEECVRLAGLAGFTLVRTQDLTAAVSPTWWHMGRALLAKPRLWRHVVRRWRFALAALRICAAYRSGALRYAALTLVAR